jgi:hypothetical protein
MQASSILSEDNINYFPTWIPSEYTLIIKAYLPIAGDSL